MTEQTINEKLERAMADIARERAKLTEIETWLTENAEKFHDCESVYVGVDTRIPVYIYPAEGKTVETAQRIEKGVWKVNSGGNHPSAKILGFTVTFMSDDFKQERVIA